MGWQYASIDQAPWSLPLSPGFNLCKISVNCTLNTCTCDAPAVISMRRSFISDKPRSSCKMKYFLLSRDRVQRPLFTPGLQGRLGTWFSDGSTLINYIDATFSWCLLKRKSNIFFYDQLGWFQKKLFRCSNMRKTLRMSFFFFFKEHSLTITLCSFSLLPLFKNRKPMFTLCKTGTHYCCVSVLLLGHRSNGIKWLVSPNLP